jgi:hypothetical protein
MKRSIVLALALGFAIVPLMAFAVIVATQNYMIDEDVSVGDDEMQAVVVDSEGVHMYLAGNDNTPGNSQGRIEKRLISDGSLVYATTSNPSAGADGFYAAEKDGSYIYAVGYQNISGSDYEWLVESRNLSDGSLVYATTSDPSAGGDLAKGISIDDSFMYVAGYSFVSGSDYTWYLERRNLSDGSLVYATSSNPSVGIDIAEASVIDDSFWYLAGYENVSGSDNAWRIEKRNLSDGSLVYATTSNPTSGDDAAESIVIDGTYMYVAGYDRTAAGGALTGRIEKRNLSDGSLVYTINSDPSSSSDGFRGVVLDDPYIYLAGYDSIPGNSEHRMEKRTMSDGALIYATSSNLTSSNEAFTNVALSGNSLIAIGFTRYGGANYAIFVQSFNIDSTPTVSSFSPVSDSIDAKSGPLTLTINGTNFSTSTTAVTWDGESRTATYVTSTQMTLDLTEDDTYQDGSHTIIIPNDDSARDSLTTTYSLKLPVSHRSSGSSARSKTPSHQETVLTPQLFQFLLNLKQGMTHPDVKELQKFLNSHGFMVSAEGAGSSGNETEFFGMKTFQALIKFQEANATTILVPNGLLKGTGYFGPATRGVVNGGL